MWRRRTCCSAFACPPWQGGGWGEGLSARSSATSESPVISRFDPHPDPFPAREREKGGLVLHIPRHIHPHHAMISALEKCMSQPRRLSSMQQQLPPARFDDFGDDNRDQPIRMLLLELLNLIEQRMQKRSVGRLNYDELRRRNPML